MTSYSMQQAWLIGKFTSNWVWLEHYPLQSDSSFLAFFHSIHAFEHTLFKLIGHVPVLDIFLVTKATKSQKFKFALTI